MMIKLMVLFYAISIAVESRVTKSSVNCKASDGSDPAAARFGVAMLLVWESIRFFRIEPNRIASTEVVPVARGENSIKNSAHGGVDLNNKKPQKSLTLQMLTGDSMQRVTQEDTAIYGSNIPPAHGRVQLNNPQNAKIQDSTQEDTITNASFPPDMGEAVPTRINARVHVLKPIVVMLILAILASATTASIRIYCNRRRNVATERPTIVEKDEPRSIDTERGGQERQASKENEPRPAEVISASREMPPYEPIHTAPNFEFTCCNCHLQLYGLSPY